MVGEGLLQPIEVPDAPEPMELVELDDFEDLGELDSPPARAPEKPVQLKQKSKKKRKGPLMILGSIAAASAATQLGVAHWSGQKFLYSTSKEEAGRYLRINHGTLVGGYASSAAATGFFLVAAFSANQ